MSSALNRERSDFTRTFRRSTDAPTRSRSRTAPPARPAAGPSQNCWRRSHMLPDGGTTRSSSIGAPEPASRAELVPTPNHRVTGSDPVTQPRSRRGRGRDRCRQPQLHAAVGQPGEPVCGHHRTMLVQPLVRPLSVIGDHPRIHRGLRLLQRGERCAAWLSGRKVPWNLSTFPFWFGEDGHVSRCVIPLRRQILSNNTSPRDGPWRLNRSVNCLPLSVITSSGTPCLSQRLRERQTHRPRRGPLHHRRHHTEPGMIIDPGDDLGLTQLTGRGVHQLHPAHDVDAPQLHRTRPLEPHVRVPRPLARPLPQQPVPTQDPVDRALRGNLDVLGLPRRRLAQQLQPDPLRPPTRMFATQLDHRLLHQPRAPDADSRPAMRPIRQPRDTLTQIPAHPGMHRRPMKPRPGPRPR